MQLRHRVIPAVLIALYLLTVGSLVEAKMAVPQVTADAVMVVDNNTGKVLYEKNADKREYPASLTKVMTAILVLEDNNNDREVTVSWQAGRTPYGYFAHTGQVKRQFDMLTQMLLLSDKYCQHTDF